MALSFPPVEYAWDLTSAQWQAKFDEYVVHNGYRPIDVGISDASPDFRYSCVLVKDNATFPTQAYHGFTASAFQAKIDELSAKGYTMTCLSVNGAGPNARFAGIWEQRSSSPVQNTVFLDVPATEFDQRWQSTFDSGVRLKSIKQYGTDTDIHYALLFYSNQELQKTAMWQSSSDQWIAASQQAYREMVYYRPLSVQMIGNPRSLVSIIYGDSYVGEWRIGRGLGRQPGQQDLKSFLANMKSQNLYPISIQKSAGQYSVIVAQTWPPVPRKWTVDGPEPVGFRDPTSLKTTLDGYVRKFMERQNIRHVQVAIGKTGTSGTSVLLQRAYTWTEPGRYNTRIDDKFLLASVSKAFCCAAVQALYDGKAVLPGKAVTKDTKAYLYLGSDYSNPADQRLKDITVQQLVDHTAGYDLKASGDPVFMAREISMAQSNGSRPTNILDMVNYMFTKRLDFDPGARYEYSNYGYVLLSAIVEAASGKQYFDYLKAQVLAPLGISNDVKPWLTPYTNHINDKIVQDDVSIGPTALDPRSDAYIPYVYGGDNLTKESTVGPSSMSTSATALVKFIAKNAAWGIGGRSNGYARTGSMAGSSAVINSRDDGLDYAVVMNARQFFKDSDVNDLFFKDIKDALDRYGQQS